MTIFFNTGGKGNGGVDRMGVLGVELFCFVFQLTYGNLLSVCSMGKSTSILESTYPQDYGENKKKRESERKEYSSQNKKTELQVFYKCRMVILLKEVRG